MRVTTLAAWVGMLGFLLAAPGCGSDTGGYGEIEDTPVVDEGHHHAEHGPHGGHLIELGNHEYHAELVFDPATHKITVYVLGAEPEEPFAVDQPHVALNLMIDGKPQQFQLAAVPQEDDADGTSSRFELAGDAVIAEHIADEEDLEGRLTVVISGKNYTGNIEHDHAGHDHGDHGDHGEHGEHGAEHAGGDHEEGHDEEHHDENKAE